MTGFGSGQAAAGTARLRVELSSVNGRGLTTKIRLPDALSGAQAAAEARLRERLARGTVTLGADLRRGPGSAPARLNFGALAAYARDFEAARKKLKDLPPVDWRTLTSLPGVLEPAASQEGLEKALLKALDQALAALGKDRAREGKALAEVCRRLLATAEAALARAEARRPQALAGFRERLSARLSAALGASGPALEPDLRRELLLQTERSDIAEEVDRLKVHLGEARRCLAASEPVGRRLDFLAQELLREANTLGAKALDADLSLAAVDLKTALDQFKEQVQNIE